MHENKHLTEEQIAQCADAIVDGRFGLLDGSLRQHLAVCDECASEVLSVSDIVVDFKEEAKEVKTIGFKPWVAAIASIAAAGLIFVVVTSVLDFNQDSEQELQALASSNNVVADTTENTIEIIDSIVTGKSTAVDLPKQAFQPKTSEKEAVTVVQKDLLAEAFVPDKTLEVLFSNFTQTYRGEDVVITSKGIIKRTETDSLKWSNPMGEELYVEFFNNKGTRIITLTKKSAGVQIPELDKGLYYWKLINQDFDLLFVGKILVE